MGDRKTYSVILGMKYDAEIVGKLETVGNRSSYIKDLIRKDIDEELNGLGNNIVEVAEKNARYYRGITEEKYKEQYDNNSEKTITFGCNVDKNTDIINKLDSVKNRSEYVKSLILIDMGLIDEKGERFVLTNKNHVENNKIETGAKKRKSNRSEYKQNYAKEHLKRIPLDVNLDFFEVIENHITITGEPRNTFIKRAIKETIERDNIVLSDNINK